MHLKVIACEIVARELYQCAARSVNTISFELLSQGLHNNSDTMRAELQKSIDAVDSQQFDAILLGYGLCNNGIVGLKAPKLDLIVPRAHDCITFLLGSKERYTAEFDAHPGTYYYSSGWLEYAGRNGERPEFMKNSGLGEAYYKARQYEELVAKYGEDNAQYLTDFMSTWTAHYTRGALIEFDFVRGLGFEQKTAEICEKEGWEFARLEGRLELLQDWLDGKWDEGRFLRLTAGQVIEADYCGQIVRCAKSAATES